MKIPQLPDRGIVCFIGRDRNEAINKLYGFTPLIFAVNRDADDLRENLDEFFSALNHYVLSGITKVCLKNVEVGIPVNALAVLSRYLREKYPELLLIYSTDSPQATFECDEIVYFGSKKPSKIQLDRVKYGNILEIIDTGLLHEKPRYFKK